MQTLNTISFNCSNLVAAQSDYSPSNDWDDCVHSVNRYYAPPDTFGARFEQMVLGVKNLGFTALDIWTSGQLNWRWATDEQVRTARDILAKHDMTVTSLGGDFGETREEFEAACRMARTVSCNLLSGIAPLLYTHRRYVLSALEEHGLFLAIENHPEKTPDEMIAEIGIDSGHLGTCIDTGWWTTQGYGAPRAIHALAPHILHVHLKDVLPGPEHVNRGYGKGSVPLQACVQALKEVGYTGDISVEDHAVDYDPTDDIKAAREMVASWLAGKD